MSYLPFRRASIVRAGAAFAGILAALAAWELALRPIARELREPPHAMQRRTAAPLTAVFPRSVFAGAFVVAAWLVGVFLLTPLRTSPFIYFKF